MTSMIDIVFQLLVFFIMTFKVVVMEGDFAIKMPLATLENNVSMDEELPEKIPIKLVAGDNGGIASIIVDGNPLPINDIFGNLNRLIAKKLSNTGDGENEVQTEVEFDIDRDLKYSFTVKAIDAVSGTRVDGKVIPLIEKMTFKDNRKSGGF